MKKTLRRGAFLALLAVGLSVPASAGELKLTMKDGRVTLIADNVPLRQILLEWARVGKAQVINAEKMVSSTITIQLIDAPEKDALDVLLRSAAGYIAAPRPVMMADAAVYDRITIMATSRAPAATAVAATPTFQRPPMPVDDGDEPINVQMPQPQPANPVTGQFPGQLPPGMQPQGMQPQGMQPQPGMGQPNVPQTSTQPGPLTSPRPGALPAPPMPAGVPNPYQPNPNIRPGGRGGGPGGQ